MSKKKKIEITRKECIAMADDGKGLVDYRQGKLPVDYLLKGEVAELEITHHYHGPTVEILSFEKESKDSVEPKCEYYFECGACHLQHMTYERQLSFKTSVVKKYLGAFGKVEKIIGMDHPYDYRNKIHSTFATTKNGKIVSGLYEERSHTIIPIERCIIQKPKADEILGTIRRLFKKYKMHTYNEYSKEGFLRHVLIRTSEATGQVMVVFVVAHKKFYSRSKIIKELLKAHPEIKTIIMNINDRDTSVVLGDYEKVLYGNGKIEDELCGLKFEISSKSFYQINPKQTEKLYNKVLEYLHTSGDEILLDAYCGIGTIGLISSKKVKEVIGVEINSDAIKNANKNAHINNIKNIKFIKADASDLMDELADNDYSIDQVIMDPPREGSDRKFLSSLVKLSPKQVIYVSCNPETQARDLKYLIKKGYQVEKIQPVDMFPQTYHIENIVSLKLK